MLRVSGLVVPYGVLSTHAPTMGGCRRLPIVFATTAFQCCYSTSCEVRDGHTGKPFPVESMSLEVTATGLHVDAVLDVPRDYVQRFTGLSVAPADCYIDVINGAYIIDDIAELDHIAWCTYPKWKRPAFPQTRFARIEEL